MLLALVPGVHAFCGTYVGPVGEAITNGSSQVIIAWQEDEVVLTMANDAQSSTRNFGMVVPIPTVIDEKDVSIPEREVIDALEYFTGPRLVSYVCDDFWYDDYDASGGGDGGGGDGGGGEGSGGVDVVNQFAVGGYEFYVLDAKGAAGLGMWLDDNGFVLPDLAEPIIDDYIEQELYFLAIKVDLDVPPKGELLPPIQLRYPVKANALSLPIRLGATVASGPQDVLVHVLSSDKQGEVGLSNSAYTKASIETDCMLADGADPSQVYAQALDQAFAGAGGDWLVEYSWTISSCDPCPSEPPTKEQLAMLGAEGLDYVTRIRARLDPDSATQDLAFYGTGMTYEWFQMKYIQYNHDLEDRYPICGVGMTENPGSCDEAGGDASGGDGGGGLDGWGESDPTELDDVDGGSSENSGRCSSTGATASFAWLVSILALATRRRD